MMRCWFLLVTLLLLVEPSFAQMGDCNAAVGEAMLDVGNVRARILNNGNLFWRGHPNVYEVPKGGGKHSILATSFWMGGFIDGRLHMAASRYGPYEYWAGPLDDQGIPPQDCSIYDRVYSVKRSDVANYERTRQATSDLADWPTGLGAPTVDAQGQPIDLSHLPFVQRLDRTINLAAGERPDLLGDQMMWWVMNDLGNTHNATDAPPLGVEVQVSAFAYASTGPLGNTTFYRYRIHYRGSTSHRDQIGGTWQNPIYSDVTYSRAPLEQSYIGFSFDPELGYFGDDYIGSDPELGLGYVYNSDNDDQGNDGYGEAPPAFGGNFIRGPTNDYRLTISDFDVGNTALRPSLRHNRLPMTTFTYYNNGGCVTCDPQNGPEYMNYMQARWRDGQRFTFGGTGRDFSNIPTNFAFPGDPTTGSFWSELNKDGQGTAMGLYNRRFVMSTGPFRMEVGEVETIDFAIVWARGVDNLDSVTQLKEATKAIQEFAYADYRFPSGPDAPTLKATSVDGNVLLSWHNPANSNNADNTYSLQSQLFGKITDAPYLLEGYDLFQYDSATDISGTLVATYDRANGITTIIEGDEFTRVTAFGNDSGIQQHHIIEGLTPYQTYYFGVQAYAYSPDYRPHVYRGPMTRISFVPTPRDGDAFNQARNATLGQPLTVDGSNDVQVSVLDPTALIDNAYMLVTYESRGQFSYDLLAGDGTILFDGNAWYERTGRTPPLAPEPLIIDGLRIEVSRDAPVDETWHFSTNGLAPQTSAETGQAALAQIGISPNPYKGMSAYEVSATQSQVRFTGMPAQATIRVYTLNGTLIQTQTKNSPEAWMAWDLRTAERREIGSGVYLIHIEVPGIGTRVLRFAVVR